MSKGLQSGVVPGQAAQEQPVYDLESIGKIVQDSNNNANYDSYFSGTNKMATGRNVALAEDDQMLEDYGRKFSVGSNYNPQAIEDVLYEESLAIGNLGKSTANLVGKTALQVGGGLAGSVYGIGAWINSGDFSSFYDNNFTDMMDSAEKGLRNTFRIYKPEEFKDANFLQKIYNPTLFIDEFSDAFAFTLGAILTQNVIGLAGKVVKASKIAGVLADEMIGNASKGLNAIDKAEKFTEGVQKSVTANKMLQRANMLQQTMLTGSMWEAITETKMAMHDLRNELKAKGLSDEEIESRVSEAEKIVLAGNVGVVSLSNMIQFGKTFATPEFLKFGKKWVQNAGSLKNPLKFHKIVDGRGKAQLVDKWTRGLISAGHLVVNPLSEGFEEFSQGALSKGILNSYGKKYSGDEVAWTDVVNGIGSAALEGITTKEGWNEIGMGMLMGIAGVPTVRRSAESKKTNDNKSKLKLGWDGGVYDEIQSLKQKKLSAERIIKQYNENDPLKAAKDIAGGLVRAEASGNAIMKAMADKKYYTARNAHDDAVYANFQPYIENGYKDMAKARFTIYKNMTDDQFNEQIFNSEQGELLKENPKQFKQLRDQFENSIENKLNAMEKAHRTIERSHLSDPAIKKMAKYYLYKAESAKNMGNEIMNELESIVGSNKKAKALFDEHKVNMNINEAFSVDPKHAERQVKTANGEYIDSEGLANEAIKSLKNIDSITDEKQRKKVTENSIKTIVEQYGQSAGIAIAKEALMSTYRNNLNKETVDKSKTDENNLKAFKGSKNDAQEKALRDLKNTFDNLLLQSEQDIIDEFGVDIENIDRLIDLFKASRSNELMMNSAIQLFNHHFVNEDVVRKSIQGQAFDDLAYDIDNYDVSEIKDEEDVKEAVESFQAVAQNIDKDIFDAKNKGGAYDNAFKKFNDRASEQLEKIKKFQSTIDSINDHADDISPEDAGFNDDTKEDGKFIDPYGDDSASDNIDNGYDEKLDEMFNVNLLTSYSTDPSYRNELLDFLDKVYKEHPGIDINKDLKAVIRIVPGGKNIDPRIQKAIEFGDDIFKKDDKVISRNDFNSLMKSGDYSFQVSVAAYKNKEIIANFKTAIDNRHTNSKGEPSGQEQDLNKMYQALYNKLVTTVDKNPSKDFGLPVNDIFLREYFENVKRDANTEDKKLSEVLFYNGESLNDKSNEQEIFDALEEMVNSGLLTITNRRGEHKNIKTWNKIVDLNKAHRKNGSELSGKIFFVGKGAVKSNKNSFNRPYKLNSAKLSQLEGYIELTGKVVTEILKGNNSDSKTIVNLIRQYHRVSGDINFQPRSLQELLNALTYNGELDKVRSEKGGIALRYEKNGGIKNGGNVLFLRGSQYVIDKDGDNFSISKYEDKKLKTVDVEDLEVFIADEIEKAELRVQIDKERMRDDVSSKPEGSYRYIVLSKYLTTDNPSRIEIETTENEDGNKIASADFNKAGILWHRMKIKASYKASSNTVKSEAPKGKRFKTKASKTKSSLINEASSYFGTSSDDFVENEAGELSRSEKGNSFKSDNLGLGIRGAKLIDKPEGIEDDFGAESVLRAFAEDVNQSEESDSDISSDDLGLGIKGAKLIDKPEGIEDDFEEDASAEDTDQSEESNSNISSKEIINELKQDFLGINSKEDANAFVDKLVKLQDGNTVEYVKIQKRIGVNGESFKLSPTKRKFFKDNKFESILDSLICKS